MVLFNLKIVKVTSIHRKLMRSLLKLRVSQTKMSELIEIIVRVSKVKFDKKSDVGDMISKILESRKSGTTKIKIEIEFSD